MPKQKAKINLALKVAIVHSGLRQRAIAAKAFIAETRLSEIVNGRGTAPSESERLALGRVLGKPVDQLFPSAAHAGGARA